MDEREKIEETEGRSNIDLWNAELIAQVRTNAKRWFAISMILLAALVGTNAYWIHMMNTYDYIYQNGSGQNNYNRNIGGNVSNVAADQDEKEWQEQRNESEKAAEKEEEVR